MFTGIGSDALLGKFTSPNPKASDDIFPKIYPNLSGISTKLACSMIAHGVFSAPEMAFANLFALQYSSGKIQYPVINLFSKNLRMKAGGKLHNQYFRHSITKVFSVIHSAYCVIDT